MNKKPDIENYLDYHRFVEDTFHYRKQHHGETLRSFAKAIGVSSPSYPKMVMDGQRDITLGTFHGFCNAMGLNQADCKFFELLVSYCHSQDIDEKMRILRKLIRRKKFREHHQIDPAIIAYLGSWIGPVLREYAVHNTLPKEPAEIAHKLMPSVSLTEIEETLHTLLTLEMIEPNSDSDGYKASTTTIRTPDGISNTAVGHYHKQLAHLAQWAISELSSEQRNYGAITVSVPSTKIDKLYQFINSKRDEIFDAAKQLQKEAATDQVVQILIQAFPATYADADHTQDAYRKDPDEI